MSNDTRLFLIFHGRYPSEKAASLFAAKSAEAFAGQGFKTTLLVPRRFGRFTVKDQEYYGTTHHFDVVYLSTIDLFRVPIMRAAAFRISLCFFSIAVWIYLRLHASSSDIVYSNETLPLLLASFVTKRITYEMHDYPTGVKQYYEFFFDRVQYVVVTNRHKITKLEASFPHAAVRALYEPNAVALDAYVHAPNRAASRSLLGLPEARIVVYTGHLYSWKGVDTLAAAAKNLDAQVYIVGGTKRDVAAFTSKWGDVTNLHILGHRPYNDMVLWQKAADVVVLPNTGKEDISVEYTSPMKLFEYMASGTPIVASDLPAIREIVGAGRAVLVTPDDPNALAQGIRNIFEQGGVLNSMHALEWVKDHTWEKRAYRILTKLQATEGVFYNKG
jgi:glycosyltransferase involved in cell wall biosynthesis